jgi:hypothetical protein
MNGGLWTVPSRPALQGGALGLARSSKSGADQTRTADY